ncbi:hypothetical protein AZE42_11553 [Rhizopogon vesiculosus]|uniref:Uncharacterized protein n=1 Tax=Rhizopogon vesiculosus TaxID=180088 RepID=A0A1J8QQJ5_9AGAM|nr:hypothetical protein AZE42_11553 [Rhizopogon vesiculosus]
MFIHTCGVLYYEEYVILILLEIWKDEKSNAKVSDSESKQGFTTKKPYFGKLRPHIPRPNPSTCEEDGNESVEEVVALPVDEDCSEDSDKDLFSSLRHNNVKTRSLHRLHHC